MAFGGGFGGFGTNNNNNNAPSTGFGGFSASTNNPASGFGTSNASNTGFAASTGNAGGSLFGGGSSTAGGFGTGGFGSNNNTQSAFGAKPAFGAPATGGGLFGNTANTTAGGSSFGGFGSTTANQSSGFGASNTGTSMFGANNNQNKPAFGSTNTTGGGMFGGGNTNNGFGAPAAATPSFGFGQQQQAAPVNQGTAATPFAAHIEKDTGASSSSHYQSLGFTQPYQNFSFEELRVADYNAGRRFGNSNGQAGAFGQSTGFGGFGANNNNASSTGGFGSTNTGGGLFGASNNAASTTPAFGTNNNASTGFGGGGLFGSSQNKPAGGLFGSSNTATTGAATGGLFGTTNNQQPATGGFGGFGTNNTTANTGNSLFGANNANMQNQAKPFGGFGTTNTTGGFGASTTGGFGAPAAQSTGTGGMFGATTTNNAPFGGQQNTQSSGLSFGGFGQNQNNQNQAQQANTGNSLFGAFGGNQNNQNQPKPGGLFGSTAPATGGLFGQNNNQQQGQTSSLFGSNNNTQQAGGLFGSKPATTGTGLFGSTANNNTNSGTSLFGGAAQNQSQGTGLFGQPNNQQKSLFGSTTNNVGSGMFGGLGQNNNNNSTSLFGAPQQNNNAGNSLFGSSQQNQQQAQQPQSLTASLMQNPYGNDQLFANLGTPAPSVGPIATPLAGAQKAAKKPQAVPAFKINPSASMRLITPQKRPSGYGFSYSTYGTPASASQFTPGRSGGSLFNGANLNRPLSKSLSTSNLRTPLAPEESVLAPGAFTPNYRPYSSGNSIRRLKIDRNLRTDLFGGDQSDRNNKRVSFDGTTAARNGIGANNTNGTATPGPHNSLVRADTAESDTTIEDSRPEPISKSSSQEPRANGGRPEMEQVRGNELAIVPEDEQVHASTAASAKTVRKSTNDQEAGDYYSIPSIKELRDMSRDQLKNVSPFVVGRTGIGRVEFSKVDLTTVPLDQIINDIVQLQMRSATVYQSGVNKPPQGKGLNVPSTIHLENSWPRSAGGRQPVHDRKGPQFDKHVARLKRVGDTEFINYDADTGEWTFRVQHFTTYGLDDDDDESMLDEVEAEDAPSTPTPKPGGRSQAIDLTGEESMLSPANSDPDDTFDFKRGGKTVPGGFDSRPLFEDDGERDPVLDDSMSEDGAVTATMEDPFNVQRSIQRVPSPPDTDDESQHVVGAFPAAAPTMPKSILKPTNMTGTPARQNFELTNDWAQQLQRTVSPRKQDRKALREQQNILFQQDNLPKHALNAGMTGSGFATTMDIMNSLWTKPKNSSSRQRGASPGGKRFEWPYQKRTNGDLDTNNMSEADQSFHASFKPAWAADGTLVYAAAGNAPALGREGLLVDAKASVVSEGKDVRFAKLNPPSDTLSASLAAQLSDSALVIEVGRDSIPYASMTASEITFSQLVDVATNDAVTTEREQQTWRLAAILFDAVAVSCADFAQGVPSAELKDFEAQIRRDAVLTFWRGITKAKATRDARDTATAEEKALAYLSCGNIESACATLVDGHDYKLATIISQLPADEGAQDVIRKQISAWRQQTTWSEFSPAIRALYEIAAGNFSHSEGYAGPAEDRASSFSLSEHFGMNWQQACGLRLFYSSNDLDRAIQLYDADVNNGKEKVLPMPERRPGSTGDDVLLGLLRLWAQSADLFPDDGDVCDPSNFSPLSATGSPLNARLSWQLVTLLSQKSGIFDPSHLDNLTSSFAQQLESVATQPAILAAVTVLLHLSDPGVRVAQIKSLLTRRAALLTPATAASPFTADATREDPVLSHLTAHRVPASWLFSARALLAASEADHDAQAANLFLAGDYAAAHAVLEQHVGPRAVIERDYAALAQLLARFEPVVATAGGNGGGGDVVPGWRTGGQVYADYLCLLQLTSSPPPATGGSVANGSTTAATSDVARRLLSTLPNVRVGGGGAASTPAASAAGDNGPSGGRSMAGLTVRVAVAEMSRVVESTVRELSARPDSGDVVAGHGHLLVGDEGKRLVGRLPLAGDGMARQGEKLWALYGRALQVR